MPWTSLANRLPQLPLILCGPLVRRVEPRAVTIWVALKAPRHITLRIYTRDAAGTLRVVLAGTRRTVRLGDGLHLAAITARTPDAAPALTSDYLYYYDLFFAEEETGGASPSAPAPSLATPGVLLADPTSASDLERLVYPGHPLPAFVLPPADLGRVRLFHGSCRKPHGVGHDALLALDLALDASASDGRPADRPQQLFLTGDQIYADDVAASVLFSLIDLEAILFAGNQPEELPLVGLIAGDLAPLMRDYAVADLARFTTVSPANHLLSRAEYCGMYLLSWSGALWPTSLPTIEDIWATYPDTRPTDPAEAERIASVDAAQRARVEDFRASLPLVRRALANIATYMVFDDHDVTDDWFLDGAWCQDVLASPLGRRIVRNGLFAYAFFQAWGNDPEQFAGEAGAALLAATDLWRGDEADPRHADEIERRLGMPASFLGAGELEHPAGALRWPFQVDTPAYRVLVLDERTRRTYATPKAAPGLLSPSAIEEQVERRARPADLPTPEVTIIVAQTPVLGVDLVERVQTLSSNNYAFDRESWSLDREIHQRFLRALAPLRRVVILSGDVHYAFGTSLEYWDETRDPPQTAKYVNFVSSSLKNEAAGTQKALLTVAYPEIFWLLSRGRMPPIELFAWDLFGGDHTAVHAALASIRARAWRPLWAANRLIEALRSPVSLVLPARGWPRRAFAADPPDRRLRLRYLRDVRLAQTGPSEPPPGEAEETLPEEVARIHAARLAPTDVLTSLQTLETLSAEHRERAASPDERARAALTQRAIESLRQVVRGAEKIERGLLRRMITALVARRDLWERAWRSNLHIVGDTNLGEIRFTPDTNEAIQYLWWWREPSATQPAPSTEYRAVLEPPTPEEAPPLP
jgi:hypothetical protein